ncbi:Phosphatidyl serine synthase [Cryptosporidium felis]|nr:Phosphatidyl serine synthase [Cryptosporidium felis]
MLGLNISYVLLLVFLLFQDAEGIRRALVFIDPKLSEKVPEANYAGSSCSLLDKSQGGLSNLYSKLDIFVTAHYLGWLVKTLILRDNFLVWFNSIFFEWLEITFRHILPNFYECWWDHVLLDIFGCNLLGIITGGLLIKKFGLISFDWGLGDSSERGVTETGKVSPREFSDEDQNLDGFLHFLGFLGKDSFSVLWPRAFSTLGGFISFLITTTIVQLIDLNYFFIKAEFSMPVSHWILGIRTLLLAICGAAATRELYESFAGGYSDGPLGKVSLQCWTLAAAIFTESLLCWRFKGNLHAATLIPPKFVSCVWILLLFLLFVLLFFLLLKSFRNNRSDDRKNM